jgi:hypothetical protein
MLTIGESPMLRRCLIACLLSTAAIHAADTVYQYAARSSVGLADTSGREIDYLGWMRGLAAADVTNWSLGGLHRLTPAWAITYDMVRGTQSNVNPQQGLRLGLRHDF